MINISHVTKYYGAFRALTSMSFDVHEGEYIGLLGSNGSGKSTLYRCILGIVGFEGQVLVNGKDSFREGKTVRAHIGYMPQQASLHNDLTVSQTLEFYSELRGGSSNEAFGFLERVELSDVSKSKVGELSGGMKQRLSFIVALIGNPQILLLDEPTVSMDWRSQQIFLSWLQDLRSEGKTVLLSTHLRHDVLSLVDRSVTLDHGVLLETAELSPLVVKIAS